MYMQKGDVSHISVSIFVINHDMLNLNFWPQKLNINSSGYHQQKTPRCQKSDSNQHPTTPRR